MSAARKRRWLATSLSFWLVYISRWVNVLHAKLANSTNATQNKAISYSTYLRRIEVYRVPGINIFSYIVLKNNFRFPDVKIMVPDQA